MSRKALLIVLAIALGATGCSAMERLTFIRPSAARGEYTQVAPTYDVSGRKTNPRAGTGDAILLAASAATHYQRGELDLAERLATQALKASPRSGDAHTVLGLVEDARGRPAEAGEHYRQATAIAPASGVYANNYGTWLCKNGRAEESLGWFDRALADPAYAGRGSALSNAGSCARQAGQPARAETSWRQALQLQPGNPVALAGMASLQFERGQYFDARAFAERWLAVEPDSADGLRIAAQIEQKLGDNEAASRYLSRLQAISPGSSTDPRTQ